MNAIFRKLVDIREGEAGRVWLMFSYSYLVISSYLILKPMTRSLFLKNLGPAQLPFVYMLVALVVGVVAVLYARFAARVRLDRLINGTTLFLILNLIAFWWLLRIEVRSAWLFYGLYVWASIYGVLTTSQFWLLANYVFNPREAKRIFPFLTAGAILGGIFGGYLTRGLVGAIGGTANLAFFCIGFLGATSVLMNLAWRRRDRSQEKPRAGQTTAAEGRAYSIIQEVLLLIRKSPHLALLMGIVAMTVMVSQIADFQFNTFASQEIAGTDELTGFLGFWLSNLSVISLVFQILFAGAIIRRFGVGGSIFFLPVAMLLASSWVLLGYGLVSILAIKISDGAFRYSINKAGLELLFLPIPEDVKKKTKAFVDMFADRAARGVAGFLLLIFYTGLGLSVAQISLVSVALISLWLVVVVAIRREYVESFRRALEKRRIDAEALTVSIRDLASVNSLIAALASRNERHVVYALKLLQSVRDVDLAPPLIPLLQHPSEEVRLWSLRLLLAHDVGGHQEVEPLVRDPSEEVRREAVRYSCRFAGDGAAELLRRWLRDEHIGLRGAALYCAAERPELATAVLAPEVVESLLENGHEARGHVATALGVIEDASYHGYLVQLVGDPHPEVRERAMASAAMTKSRRFVPLLLDRLESRSDRRAAREALASFGDSILGTLSDHLNDSRVSPAVRRSIIRVLGLMGTQNSVDVLLDSLEGADEPVEYDMIKSLNKLRARYPQLQFDDRVDRALIRQTRGYYELLVALHCSDGDGAARESDSGRLLRRALREHLDDHLERIFRLLGLRYPPKDIYNAYTATRSSNRAVRASAVEFLDNILPKDLKNALLPIVDELPMDHMLRHAQTLFRVRKCDRAGVLSRLARDTHPWLRACALLEIGNAGAMELQDLVEQARQADHAVVKETAELVLRRYFPGAIDRN